MRKRNWLLPLMMLSIATPAARTQFGPPYRPMPGRPNVPDIYGGRHPFGPRTSSIPGISGGYDPFSRTPFPVSPFGPQTRMPPTVQDILNQHGVGNPILGQRFNPFANFDPLDPQSLIYGPSNGIRVNPAIQGVRIDPMVPSSNPQSIQPLQFDPKVFELPKSPSPLNTFEPKAPMKVGGGGPPAWLRWEYPVGVFLVAVISGLLHALLRRNASES